jgi:hypothetical protein
MTLKLKILAALIGISLFVYIIQLVKKRKLMEEYAWLWLATGATIVVLSLWYDLLVGISEYIGGIFPSAVLFLFALIFLLLILLQMSVKISKLSVQVKNLAQKLALDERAGRNK